MEILKNIHYAITAISPFLMIVFCIYGLVSWADCDEDGENIAVALAVITLIVFILSLAAWGIGDSVCAKQSAVEELNAVENIVALSDNSMVNGRIYMRGGYIDNDLWYQYMVKVSNDGFVANKLKANTVTLYYTKENYRVEWWRSHKQWLWFEQNKTYHKIYIPEGSIANDFSVDLR